MNPNNETPSAMYVYINNDEVQDPRARAQGGGDSATKHQHGRCTQLSRVHLVLFYWYFFGNCDQYCAHTTRASSPRARATFIFDATRHQPSVGV
jgi:hypothetical protein